MINIIAAATIALSTPTDTATLDSCWVSIIDNWEMNLTDDEANTINNFLDNSVDSTWTETAEGWEDIYYRTNESFDTIVAHATDTASDRYFIVKYWGEETQDTVEILNEFSDDLTKEQVRMIQKFAKGATIDTSYAYGDGLHTTTLSKGDTIMEYDFLDWDFQYFLMYTVEPQDTTSK